MLVGLEQLNSESLQRLLLILVYLTIAEIANTTIEHEIDGISFLSHLKGKQKGRSVIAGTRVMEGPMEKSLLILVNGNCTATANFIMSRDVTENNPIKINRLNDKVRHLSKLQKELDRMKGTRTIFDLSKYPKADIN